MPWSAKVWQVYLLAFARCALQAARLAVAPLLVFIQLEKGFDTMTKGRVLAAFPAGYLMTQVVGGSLSDRIGGKPVMTISLWCTCVCTLLLPVASHFGTTALWVVLFAEGALQGPTFPTNAVILGKWVSPKERSWANAMTEAGSPLGGLIAMGLSPVVCTAIGWHATCVVFGVAVGLFTLLWQLKASSDPGTCTYITKEELDSLVRDGVYDPTTPKQSSRGRLFQLPTLPLRVMIAPSALVVMSSHAIYNFGRYFLYFWMPSYFTEGLGLEPHIAGFYLVLPELCGAVFTALGGVMAGRLGGGGGWEPTQLRKLFSGIGFVGAGIAMLLLSVATGPMFAMLALCIEGSLNALHGSGFKANYQDLTSTHRGALSGVGNTVATLASTVGPVMIAGLLETFHSWPMNFGFIALCFFVGAISYLTFADTNNLDLETDANSHRATKAKLSDSSPAKDAFREPSRGRIMQA